MNSAAAAAEDTAHGDAERTICSLSTLYPLSLMEDALGHLPRDSARQVNISPGGLRAESARVTSRRGKSRPPAPGSLTSPQVPWIRCG